MLGYARADLRSEDSTGAFSFGGRGDLLLGRKRESDFAIGPYVDLVTRSFGTFEPGSGIEGLIPIFPSFPLVIGAGAFVKRAPSVAWEPGIETTVLFGPRSYNFHALYSMSMGLFAQVRYGLGDSQQGDVVVGLQLDVVLLALPFLLPLALGRPSEAKSTQPTHF